LMVGKQVPVVQGFNAGHLKDLSAVAARWAQQFQQRMDIVCLAGGLPSSGPEVFRSATDRIMSEVVVGLKVAEVDYTSPNQPYFSVEKLRNFIDAAHEIIPEDMWREIAGKPYVTEVVPEKPWKGNDYYRPNDFTSTPNSIYVVSTYPNAFVNIVFGVRKQGSNGKSSQVVGISCHMPESHVCKLEVDDRNHQQRLQMTTGVEGVPFYHLLPELCK